MAFTFRNSTRLVDQRSKIENRNAPQERSAPGPHQGEGGQNVSLEQAVKSFDKRNGTSPLKRDATLEHAEWHFSKREAGTPAKKCSPITQRSSPLKMNEALVAGAGDVARKFVDVGAEVKKVFEPLKPEPKVTDLSKTSEETDPSKNKEQEKK
jgi:hypothetical protein